jgi:cbb3-type cytochrome oxidase subunit 3
LAVAGKISRPDLVVGLADTLEAMEVIICFLGVFAGIWSKNKKAAFPAAFFRYIPCKADS